MAMDAALAMTGREESEEFEASQSDADATVGTRYCNTHLCGA